MRCSREASGPVTLSGLMTTSVMRRCSREGRRASRDARSAARSWYCSSQCITQEAGRQGGGGVGCTEPRKCTGVRVKRPAKEMDRQAGAAALHSDGMEVSAQARAGTWRCNCGVPDAFG